MFEFGYDLILGVCILIYAFTVYSIFGEETVQELTPGKLDEKEVLNKVIQNRKQAIEQLKSKNTDSSIIKDCEENLRYFEDKLIDKPSPRKWKE